MAMQSSPETPQPLARVVSEVKGWVGRLGSIWVTGQVIELRRRSGAVTHFLTLRDRNAPVSARMTCSTLVLDQAGPLTEGAQVVALVRPRVWEKNSSLTFECAELRLCGEGRLLAELEQRKRLLQAEGLFDPVRKMRLPFLPRGIGLIAGQGSDAERDVRTHVLSRWPSAALRFVPALVQGPRAAESVMLALRELDADSSIDVIVIARGGGSLEDLLPFSDEGLIRAVAACRTPVVSAIGHEADFPIIDLVADVRASTPTDAAKFVVPDATQEADRMATGLNRIRAAIQRLLNLAGRDLAELCSRPALRDPTAAYAAHHERLGHLRHRLDSAWDRRISDEQLHLRHALMSVRTMSPKATLERGYSILVTTDGLTVSSASQVAEQDTLRAHLAAGELSLTVSERYPDEDRIQQSPTNINLSRSSRERH